MDEKILKWLYDVKWAINEINTYFNKDISFEEYSSNTMLKRAVERDFEIIGEAINRILKKDSSFEDKISESRNIIGLRNLIIHAYDSISDESIWSIIIQHLPQLEKEVNILVNENK